MLCGRRILLQQSKILVALLAVLGSTSRSAENRLPAGCVVTLPGLRVDEVRPKLVTGHGKWQGLVDLSDRSGQFIWRSACVAPIAHRRPS